MESFFGRMKCELLDLIALCPSADVVAKMVDGYMTAYNTQHYQYALAGLTPSEYYTYVTTGIYPVDNYYGIKATELMPIKAWVEARLNAAADKAKRMRIATAEKRKAAQQICKTPEMIVARDQRILCREISKWTRSKATAVRQISHLKEVLKRAQKAGAFLMSAPAELIMELTDGRNWSAHPELSYIYEMRELF